MLGERIIAELMRELNMSRIEAIDYIAVNGSDKLIDAIMAESDNKIELVRLACDMADCDRLF